MLLVASGTSEDDLGVDEEPRVHMERTDAKPRASASAPAARESPTEASKTGQTAEKPWARHAA